MALLLILPLLAAGTDILTDDPHPVPVTFSGPYAVGPAGTPLYTGEGMCDDECQKSWPVLKAETTDKPVGDWHPYQGQWTFKGKSVHYFSGDRDAAKAMGEGIGNLWHTIRHLGRMPRLPLPAQAKVGKSESSFLLTDYRGHTLYTFSRDGGTPACKARCLEVWPPLLAPGLAEPIGDWTPIDRPDGVRQWSYRGRLLYTFADDITPADKLGANAGGVWKVVPVGNETALATK